MGWPGVGFTPSPTETFDLETITFIMKRITFPAITN